MIFIGDLVNTHGINGEVRVISNFKYKEKVFRAGNRLFINDKEYIISTCRKHKMFDLLTFEGFNNINDVLTLKGSKLYINKDDYVFDGPLNEELYGKKVYDKDRYIGILKEIVSNKQELLVIEKDGKTFLVPYVDEFVKEIKDDIKLDLIRGFIDED